MVSYAPPTADLPHFNPALFTQDETALTIGEANKIFFKKSGGIITGAISAPSLTLNGVNVENKLLEIDTNNAKLTDISYNNNVTSILNDLSVNGVLKLNGLPNAGQTIIDNKQKITKISYDSANSVTTIGDTLKASSTLIVGNLNYNASDEFYKLTGISRGVTSILTITDTIDLTGNLNLPSYGNVDAVLTQFDQILTNMSYTSFPNLLTISSNVNIPQNLQLGTITDVEQKIIDISNTTTNLETILTDISYVNSTTVVGGKLSITEATGTAPSAFTGSLTLSHGNNGGTSSIVFKSKKNPGSDYGYISYKDDISGHTDKERSLLEIGVKDDINPIYVDNIALMPSGYVGINTRSPQSMLDVNGDIICNGNFELGTINDVEQKLIDISNGGTPYISYDAVNDKLVVEKDMDLSVNDLTCNFMRPVGSGFYGLSQNWADSHLYFQNGGHHIDVRNANGTGRTMYLNYYSNANVVLGGGNLSTTTTNRGNLLITEGTGTARSSSGGSLTFTHNDVGGESSIVFKSKKDPVDYGYISYKDDYLDSSVNERSLLEIGVQNDAGVNFRDNISLMPSGFVGINTRTPQSMLDVNGDIKCNGNFELGTINDVEQKIIDISNSIIPYISYDSVNDKLNVEKDLDLSGNVLYIDNLYIQEATGTAPIGQKGSLTLIHQDQGGTSSIVFRSAQDVGVDHGYISYTDDYAGSTTLNRSLLEIGCKNDSGTNTIDNIALMPSGFVGVNTRTPQTMLDVNGDISCNGRLHIIENSGTTHGVNGGSLVLQHNNVGGESTIVFKSAKDPNTDYGYIQYIDDISGDSGNERSLLAIGTQNDGAGNYVDNVALLPSGYVGIKKITPQTELDVNGDINCNEIQVNSIPLNSFTHYLMGSTYRPPTGINWGRGQPLIMNTPTNPYKSHTIQFNDSSDCYFNCVQSQLGTYEITANVVYRNTSSARKNPCIGIAVNDDTNDTVSAANTSPEWNLLPYYQTPFAVSYVRYGEGKVCSLTAKRIHHFTNTTDIVSINTYVQSAGGDTFDNIQTDYFILSASIQFKYIGNFDNITV